MCGNSFENHAEKNRHLAQEHGLIKTTAYICSNDTKKQSDNAARVAKLRKKKKENGIVQVDLPIGVAQEIKAAGSFEKWSEKFKPYSEEKIRKIKQDIEIANRVYQLPKWKRWLIGF